MSLRFLKRRRERADAIEREKEARLEQAERELGNLQARSYHATQFLDARANRNHWRQSIEQMIQGV